MDLSDFQREVTAWGRSTFGPTPPADIAARMNVEVAELVNGFVAYRATAPGSPDRLEIERDLGLECADVLIMLVQVASGLGIDLSLLGREKFAVVQARQWKRVGLGKVQHVEDPEGLTREDYEATLASHRRLVRELDVLLNGEGGAAQQASLCDIVSQVQHAGLRFPNYKES